VYAKWYLTDYQGGALHLGCSKEITTKYPVEQRGKV